MEHTQIRSSSKICAQPFTFWYAKDPSVVAPLDGRSDLAKQLILRDLLVSLHGAPERDVMWDPHATCSTSWKDAFLIIHIFYGHMSHIGGWFFTMFDQNSGIHLLHFTT